MTGNPDAFGAKELTEMHRHRLQLATSAYEQIITRLWGGNGAGALAALAAIGSGKASTWPIIVALSAFVLGIVLLGAMTIWSLVALAYIIQDLENAESVLELKTGSIRRPSKESGLSIYDHRTVMGLLSSLMFLAGVVFGLLAATRVVLL